MAKKRKQFNTDDTEKENIIIIPKSSIIKKDSKYVEWKMNFESLVAENKEFLAWCQKEIVSRRNLYGSINEFSWGHGAYDNLGVSLLGLILKEARTDKIIALRGKDKDIEVGHRGFILKKLCEELQIKVEVKTEKDALADAGEYTLVFCHSGICSVDLTRKLLETGTMVHIEGLRPYAKTNYVIGPWRRTINEGDELLGVEAYRFFTEKLLEQCDFNIEKLDVGALCITLSLPALAACGESNGVAFNPYVYLKRC